MSFRDVDRWDPDLWLLIAYLLAAGIVGGVIGYSIGADCFVKCS